MDSGNCGLDHDRFVDDHMPHMTNHLVRLGIRAVLVLAVMARTCSASDARQTPLVRAIQHAKASVVNIHSEKTTHAGDSLFSISRGRKVNGMGTGIILDARGYIVTNHHVVNGVDSLRVTLVDGSTYAAKVISFDSKRDLAIIKIEASRDLSVMPLGTSSDLMLGETVIAVGNAFGYEHTVTSGIISSLSRDVEVNEKQSYQNLIQTDASINPGNSGGPLINMDGEVVGINVAIRAGAQRIGFAIPIDDARKIIAELISIEHLDHHYHGLLSRDRKSGRQRQMIVEAARPNSPADKAGFKAGDVVLQAGSIKIIDRADFELALLKRSANENIEVRIRRGNEDKTLSLVLADQTDHPVLQKAGNDVDLVREKPATIEKTWRTLGVRLDRLPTSQRDTVGDQYRGGMRITAVRPTSPAAKNGIRPGDILVGLHIWETTSNENISYVLEHPQLTTFNPLKFYIVRGQETLYGYLKLVEHTE